jgi:hypothetical protein
MNLPKFPIGEGGLPDVEEIQRLVASSDRYIVKEIDQFNSLANVAMSNWHSSVDRYIAATKNKTTTQKVLLKLWQPKEPVVAAKMLFKPKSFEIVDTEAIYYTSVETTTFTNIGMIAHDGVVGVAFIDTIPEREYDEAVFVPVAKTGDLRISSQVFLTNI